MLFVRFTGVSRFEIERENLCLARTVTIRRKRGTPPKQQVLMSNRLFRQQPTDMRSKVEEI